MQQIKENKRKREKTRENERFSCCRFVADCCRLLQKLILIAETAT